MSIIRIRNARKKLDETKVLKGIDLDVKKGEIIALVGPSGSGKSTLLRTLNRLIELDSGTVKFKLSLAHSGNKEADNVKYTAASLAFQGEIPPASDGTVRLSMLGFAPGQIAEIKPGSKLFDSTATPTLKLTTDLLVFTSDFSYEYKDTNGTSQKVFKPIAFFVLYDKGDGISRTGLVSLSSQQVKELFTTANVTNYDLKSSGVTGATGPDTGDKVTITPSGNDLTGRYFTLERQS